MPRTPEMQSALALSAELISELQASDVLLISTPMYNFTIPAVLKSWLDYVVRPGYTFRLAPGWPGMLENKKARVIVASRDSYPSGELGESWDQVTPITSVCPSKSMLTPNSSPATASGRCNLPSSTQHGLALHCESSTLR